MSRFGLCDVSVIIPAYNCGPELAAQLRALGTQGHDLKLEILVADNGSTDGSVLAAVEARDDPRLRWIDASQRKGPSYARNMGASQANGALLLFCDADDIVRPGWVSALVRTLTEFDLAGGLALTGEVNSPQVLSWYSHSYAPPRDQLPKVFLTYDAAASNNLGVRREAFELLGGFDVRLDRSGEDLDFCIRAAQNGLRIGFSEAQIDYRLRDRIPSFLKQQYAYGRGWAQVYFSHAETIPLRRGRKEELRMWARHFARLPSALLGRGGVAWAGSSALNIGRLVESARRKRLSL